MRDEAGDGMQRVLEIGKTVAKTAKYCDASLSHGACASIGLSAKICAEIFDISSTGNASEAGLPAAREIKPGSEEYFNISRMAEGARVEIRLANL